MKGLHPKVPVAKDGETSVVPVPIPIQVANSADIGKPVESDDER
jgi:hypothetical protein